MSEIFVSPVAALDGLLVDGMTILSYGAHGSAMPASLVACIRSSGVGNITVVTDTCHADGFGLQTLLERGQVGRVITACADGNPLLERLYQAGRLQLELEAPAVLAERLAAGRLGAQSFLTRTGVGSAAAEGKPLEAVGDALLVREAAIAADLAVIHAWRADTSGNLGFRTRMAGDHLLATAARVTVVQVDEVVAVGALSPEAIHIRGMHVDRIVRSTPCPAGSHLAMFGDREAA